MKENSMENQSTTGHFIKTIIEKDMESGKFGGRVGTRFPPEPNGYLHLGHAKSICLNFGMAREYNGTCNLRFDDTNPAKKYQRYIDAIIEDVRWLGFDWGETIHYASDYFEKLYNFAVDLIKAGNAFVCDLSFDQMREYRGTLTQPGRDSPHRNRTVEENLDLFSRMRNGEFDEGSCCLRAKIDMSSPNIILRDPVIYRIKKIGHPRTGDTWCIYPMYDFTHCISDSLENITHSLCTLEFQDNRALYDWTLDHLDVPCHPQQIEFARMNLDYTIMSKRKLQILVDNHHVEGWDDPRLPTLAGIRRRGYTPEAIRNFCATIGVSKKESRIDMGLLENVLREDLNQRAPRVMGVINPLRVIIENWPGETVEELDAANHPQRPEMGSRKVTFGREIFIEQEDFMEDPPKKFFRLGPGREVRLRYAYFITCREVVKDESGKISHLVCTYDPETRGGDAPDGRKVKGTLHWVSAQGSVPARVRLYDRLFSTQDPEAKGEEFIDKLNPDSLVCLDNARVETSAASTEPGTVVQFERLGYFCLDTKDSTPDMPVFNRTVTLRDTWAKRR